MISKTTKLSGIKRVIALLFSLLCCTLYVSAQQGAGWYQAVTTGYELSTVPLQINQNSPTAQAPGDALPPLAAPDFPVAQEVRALAKALGNNPLAIFNWVRNNVDYVHYRGAKKGALTTLIERSGNDFDQSLLLRDMLVSAGIPAKLHRGINWIPYQSTDGIDLRHWLCLPQAAFDNLHVDALLLSRGTQLNEVSKDQTQVQIMRTWVEATVGGAPKQLDPSFKKYERVAGIGLAQAAGYLRTTALAQLGGTIGDAGRSVTNANEKLFGDYLINLSENLADYFLQTDAIEGQDPLGVMDVVGGWRLKEWVTSSLDDAFPLGAYSSESKWDNPPLALQSRLRLRLGTNPQASQFSLEGELPLHEFAGRRLTLEFASNAGKTKAQLWLDDVLWKEESSLVEGDSATLEVRITHPTGDGRLDQVIQQGYKRKTTANGMPNGTPIYALVYAFDVSKESLRRSERSLEAYKSAGKGDRSREVMGATLNMIGQQWFLQTQNVLGILSGMRNCSPQMHHRFGRVAQEEGTYIDVMGQRDGTVSRVGDQASNNAVFSTSSFYWSAMEHSVLDQLQGTSAASTVGLISRANSLGSKVFVLPDMGAYNAVRTQLAGYPAADLTTFATKIGAGATVVCPANADLRLNPEDLWHGSGYVHASLGEIGMIINGKYNGGYSSNNFLVSSAPIIQSIHTAPSKHHFEPASLFRSVSYDPVDLQTGNFLYAEGPDLAVGNTISFARSYDGARRTQNSAGLGYGWTHSGVLKLTERTSVESALGGRGVRDMVALLASALTTLDLFESRATGADYQKKWIGSVFAAKWAVDQLKDNSVTVQLPEKTLEFIRLPWGDFVPPPGVAVELRKKKGVPDLVGPIQYPDSAVADSSLPSYTITPRNGATTLFEPDADNLKEFYATLMTDLWQRTTVYSYLKAGGQNPWMLSQIKDPFGRTITLSYEGQFVKSVSDSTGRSVSYGYDSAGNLTKFTDAEVKSDSYEYDSLHRITATKDAYGRIVVKNVYDAEGRVREQYNQGLATRPYFYDYAVGVTREKNPTGAVTQHLFDEKFRNIGTINALGHRHRIVYDERDRKVSETSPLGRTSKWSYDSFDNLRTITDATGAITINDYDYKQRLRSVTDPLGRVTTTTYNDQHQPRTFTNSLNETTVYEYYDGNGYLESITNPIGHKTSFMYDGYGNMNRVTFPDLKFSTQETSARGDVTYSIDEKGIRTDFGYNARRELVSTTKGGRSAIVSYDANRMLWRTTNPRNYSTSTTFSATKKPLVVTGPDGAKTTTTYNVLDLAESLIGPMGETSKTGYDSLSRPRVSLDPLERSVIQNFDADGMPTVTQAPLARNSTFVYQIGPHLPRLTTQINALGHSTRTEVDAAGQKRFITNRMGQTYEIRYDALGRVVNTIQPGGRTLANSYAWNTMGRTATVTEPSGQSTALQYDNRERLVTRTGPDAVTSLAYDANGNLLTTREGAAVITRTYESTRDVLSSYTNAEGERISYSYDANGNLLTLTYPGGKVVTYGYDANDNLVKVTDWAGRVTRFGYDPSGRMVSLGRPNGSQRRMAYDAAGQLTFFTEVAKSGALIASQSWNYDAGGRAVQRLRAPAAAAFVPPSYAATYHPDNRLQNLTPGGGGMESVISDADGNVTSVPLWEPARTWQGASLAWDARNRLTAISTGASNIAYGYDAEGNLIRRTQNGQTSRYTVDPGGSLSRQLIEHRPDGSKIFFVYGTGLLYEERFSAANASLGTRSYHFDQTGSTVALTADSGLVSGRFEYTAYGLTSHTSGVVDTKFRYNGEYGVQTDGGTGLLQMRARWYSPGLGRFLSEDPAGFAGGMNWYAYADGNPISLMDPYGLCASRGVTYKAPSFTTVSSGYQPLTGAGVMSSLVNLVPGLNVAKNFVELSSGNDLFTGAQLSQGQSAFNVLGGALSIAGGGVGAWSSRATSSSLAVGISGAGGRSFAGSAGSPWGAAKTPTYVQMEFPFARGASIQTPGVTTAGETFVRVGAAPQNLKFGSTSLSGAQPGTYAFPEATFNSIGQSPTALKNFGDLPGAAPQYFRTLSPPAGTPIQRGIVPGGEFGGVGGVEEVIFPKGF